MNLTQSEIDRIEREPHGCLSPIDMQKLIAAARAFTAAKLDGERLDWIEQSKVCSNRLSIREKMNSNFWHLYWGEGSGGQHFGGEETIGFDIRTAIDAAMNKTKDAP